MTQGEMIDIPGKKPGGVVYIDEVPIGEPEIQDFKPEIWISAGAACIIIACSFLVFSLITGHIVVNISK